MPFKLFLFDIFSEKKQNFKRKVTFFKCCDVYFLAIVKNF